jgi:predicted DCC family thiol-disulfide oxidoreductase YuxK
VLRLDRRSTVRFAPLGGELARRVLDGHPDVRDRDVDSLILLEPSGEDGERIRVKSGAVLGLARHLGGAWRVLEVFWLVPRPLRDWAYDFLARYRYALFGRFDGPPPPPDETGSRFLA